MGGGLAYDDILQKPSGLIKVTCTYTGTELIITLMLMGTHHVMAYISVNQTTIYTRL